MKKIDEKAMECKVRDTVLRILERAMHYNNTSTKQELTERLRNEKQRKATRKRSQEVEE